MSKIAFDFIKNARDLGGYQTSDGRITSSFKIIRSGCIYNVDDFDTHVLKDELHVDKIIDFRNSDERGQTPDVEIPGIDNLWLPIFRRDGENEVFSRLSEDEYHISFVRKIERIYELDPDFNIYDLMTKNYIDFVTDPYCISQFRKLIDLLLIQDGEHALLYHCAGGKDRAGGASVIILALLGVSDDDIKYDYMLTGNNVALENEIEIEKARRDLTRPHLASILDACMNVHERYIDTMLSYMKEREGDVISYIKKYFSVSDREIELLRDKYCE